MKGEVKCYRCKEVTPLEMLSGFDVMSLPNGKEIVKAKFDVVDAKMYMVSLCSTCYEEAQTWVVPSVQSVDAR